MAVTESTTAGEPQRDPVQEAHRLVGKAANLSSQLRGADACLAHKEAVDLLDRAEHEDAMRNLQAAVTVPPESREFRRYCEKAQQALEVNR